MKKLFFMLACIAMSVLAMGQDNQLVWANGRLLYGTPVAGIDSLTYAEMEDVDTLHLLLPRTLIKVVHDTVYIHDTVYVETDCGGNDTPSAGIGTFSVSADKQVTFSKGNLQYTQSTNTWSFAENQWDMIGIDNVTGGSVTTTEDGLDKTGDALADKNDLFGWSTSSTNFGVSTLISNSAYSGSFVDWGINQIGNDAPNTWRTLTYDEWNYLLNTRPNANSLKGVAQVNGVHGLILFPDNWTCPAGITFKSGFHTEYGPEYYGAYQKFTAEQWSKLESAGAVFLPAAGFRRSKEVLFVQGYGRYWSAATESDGNYVYCLYFYSDEARMNTNHRSEGQAVRLVKDL